MSTSIEFIRTTILSNIPVEAGVTRIEFEGPEIAIYVRNPAIIMERTDIIRNIAKTIKKRVVVRTDPNYRKSKEETIRIIHEIIPQEANIKEIKFDDVLGEVVIRAEKTGVAYGKGRVHVRKILAETGWRPVIERAPKRESRIVKNILNQLLLENEYRLNFLRRVGERIHRALVYKDSYVRIIALGGFLEVGRSAILVETPESKVLLDLGINLGASSPQLAYPRLDIDELNIEELDAVIVSHAHLDHTGLVPLLFKYGYEGPVYMTKPTRDLTILMLQDYLGVMQREGKTPPYGEREIRKMLLHTITLKYNEVTDITPDIRLTFYNAGHILGSAMVHLHIGEGLHNIVYTSDFKYAKTRLLEKANDKFPRIETLIMESTYGGQDQPPREEAEAQLIEIVTRTISRGGKVLIPVLSVGRGQEIMLVLANAIKKKILPEIPIFIEGLIDEVTSIHIQYPELLSREVMLSIYNDENPFEADFFKRVEGREARKDIVEGEPCIIMATSGMLTGGPAVDYLRMLASDPRNSLVFVSYQVEGTLGRKIKDGAREIPIVSEDGRVEILKINLEVYSIEGFSGHSDRRQLLDFLRNIEPKPKRIILDHGEPSNTKALYSQIIKHRRRLGLPEDVEVYMPKVLESLRLV